MSLEIIVQRTDKDITISATERGEEKGICTLTFYSDREGMKVLDHIQSYQSNRGIPRMLMNRAVEEIQRWVNEKGIVVVDLVTLKNHNVTQKLMPICLGLGYEPYLPEKLSETDKLRGYCKRTYFPR